MTYRLLVVLAWVGTGLLAAGCKDDARPPSRYAGEFGSSGVPIRVLEGPVDTSILGQAAPADAPLAEPDAFESEPADDSNAPEPTPVESADEAVEPDTDRRPAAEPESGPRPKPRERDAVDDTFAVPGLLNRG